MEEQCSYCKHIQGTAIPLPGNDTDTDRIIPARYMKCITFEGLGRYAFYDARFDSEDKPLDHPLNDAKFLHHDILIVNKNFGCGSSREHAPQSLMDFGIRALIGESFAEIFAGNCTAMGIPAVTCTKEAVDEIMSLVESEPELPVEINLVSMKVMVGNRDYEIDMNTSYRNDLISGTWDTTAILLSNREEILKLAEKLPYIQNFAS